MRIKTTLYLVAFLPLLIVLLIGLVLGASNRRIDHLRQDAWLMEQARVANFELNVLTQEYLLYGGPRVEKQMLLAYRNLGEVLAGLEHGGEQPLLGVAADHRTLESLFALLLEAGNGVPGNEAKTRVAGTMLVKFQDIATKLQQLSEELNPRILALQRQATLAIFGVLCGLGLLSSLLLWLLSRRLSGGIDQLAYGVKQIESGALDHQLPVPTKGGDELVILTKAFNRMNLRLRENIAELNREIGERREAQAELQQSNSELEQFAYVVSHDLRQPLRMINSYSQLLSKELAPHLGGETGRHLGFIQEGATRMDAMLLSLLEYSRAGRKSDLPLSCSSREWLDEALHFLEPAIAEAGAEVRTEGEWPTLSASRDEMVRLFQNLIGNAIKYRRPEQPPLITVRASHQDGECLFTIEDNGIGIDPAQIPRLFRMFQRLHTRDQYQGTGIGLALCRKIAEHHGGRIWMESEGEGQGSRVTFALPCPDLDQSNNR